MNNFEFVYTSIKYNNNMPSESRMRDAIKEIETNVEKLKELKEVLFEYADTDDSIKILLSNIWYNEVNSILFDLIF